MHEEQTSSSPERFVLFLCAVVVHIFALIEMEHGRCDAGTEGWYHCSCVGATEARLGLLVTDVR